MFVIYLLIIFLVLWSFSLSLPLWSGVNRPLDRKRPILIIGAHLHPATAAHLRRHRDVAPNGLQSHIQATDKFDASIDTDTWCSSTGQNSYIWFGSDLAATSQTLDVNGAESFIPNNTLLISWSFNKKFFPTVILKKMTQTCQFVSDFLVINKHIRI